MENNITVYTGPMFSKKSSALLSAYDIETISGKSIVLLKPRLDTRFGNNSIKSRFAGVVEAKNITDISEVRNYDAQVYIIDEFQFLTGDVNVIREMADEGKIFYIAGLDMTAEKKPFGKMPELLAIADSVVKLVAVCNDCKKYNAIYSHYLGEKDTDIVIDDGRKYIVLCRKCSHKRENK